MIASINIKYIISNRLKRRAYLTGDPVSTGAVSQKVKSAFWSLRYHVRLAFTYTFDNAYRQLFHKP